MRCYYCARKERVSGDGVAVAICKRCGGGICLEHLCEVRRDRRHAGMLGQAPSQTVELLCLACAGLAPVEARHTATTGHLTGSASSWGAPVAASASSTHDESEPTWTDPASVVVAAEAYLERLRTPTRPNTRGVLPTAPVTTVARWRWETPSQWWRQHGRRWFDACWRRIARHVGALQPPQR